MCQQVNQNHSIEKPELHPVPVHSPWFHVGIDFVGPISPPSASGNSYILTLSDYFTKWVEAVPHGEFVQILNVSQSHWITVSNVGCKKGVVNIYDSIPSCYLPACTKEQIAATLFSNEKTLTLEYKAVQVQQGSNDCGLFAIAFATSLCGGENPVEINYKQHLFYSHLLNCVTKQEISVFPRSTRKRKVTKSRGTETFELFCHCRLPEQGRMIQCDHCQEWYHSDSARKRLESK